jgi:hypothetical protein
VTAKTSDQVAYGEAFHNLVELLTAAEHPHPHDAAHEFMRQLVAAGWRHVRPVYDPTPPPGTPLRPDAAADYQQAKAAMFGPKTPPRPEDEAL